MLALTPVRATEPGEHRFDDKVDDVSAAGRDARNALARDLLADIAAIDRAQLSRAAQVDAHLLSRRLEYQIWRSEVLQDWRGDPLISVGLTGDAIYVGLARDFAPLPERLRNVGARLGELPRLLSQVRESLEPARVPRIHAETAVRQNYGVLSLIDELVVPQLGVLPEAEQAQLKGVVARARAAVSQHQIWLEKRLLPEAKGEFRLGAELYDAKLRFALDSSLSRQEIHDRARAEAE